MSQNSSNLIILSVLLLLAVNIVFLDIWQFSPNKSSATSEIQIPETTTAKPVAECSLVCQNLISEEIAKILSTKSAGGAVLPSPTIAPVVPKEYYIQLGTGMTRSETYEQLSGASAFVNTNSYPKIQKVTFEVYLRNPTGNGVTLAKLFNVTDKHDVWFSEVSFEGGGTARREATITLEPGNKEYQVRLKSTLKYDVYVDNARIKITTY